ncbi:MAG: hypothetical protein JNG84_15005, partial [Archangium sp.]|nr:hypothetical protein [Archangium sp.]
MRIGWLVLLAVSLVDCAHAPSAPDVPDAPPPTPHPFNSRVMNRVESEDAWLAWRVVRHLMHIQSLYAAVPNVQVLGSPGSLMIQVTDVGYVFSPSNPPQMVKFPAESSVLDPETWGSFASTLPQPPAVAAKDEP